MKQERFEAEVRCALAMVVARRMLEKGIITQRDFRRIETIFRQKFRPIFSGKTAV
jgi:hypothetical protein